MLQVAVAVRPASASFGSVPDGTVTSFSESATLAMLAGVTLTVTDTVLLTPSSKLPSMVPLTVKLPPLRECRIASWSWERLFHLTVAVALVLSLYVTVALTEERSTVLAFLFAATVTVVGFTETLAILRTSLAYALIPCV